MRPTGRRAPFAALGVTISLVAGALLPVAVEAAAPQDFSAADQYVESVPTSRGSSPASAGQGRNAPLPPGVSGRLGGETGEALRDIATSSRLGAPQQRLDADDKSAPSVPSAAVSAIDDGEGGGLLWLLLALLTVTALLAGTAGHRYFNQRDTTGRA